MTLKKNIFALFQEAIVTVLVIDLAVSMQCKQLLVSRIKRRRDEENPMDHRILPRGKRIQYDHERAKQCIMADYLDSNAIFVGVAFQQMFRISRTLFEKIAQRLANKSSFFIQGYDSRGVAGACPQAKFMIALKALAYGCTPFAFRDYFQMSRTLSRDSFDTFVSTFREEYQEQYLRAPSQADLKRIRRLHESVHGIPGMLGSLDVVRVDWNRCPKAHHGSYQGCDKKNLGLRSCRRL